MYVLDVVGETGHRSTERRRIRVPGRREKGKSLMLDEPVTLTARQTDFCRMILCVELDRISHQLARNQDESGNPLDDEARHDLTYRSIGLQLTLMALGMTSASWNRRTGIAVHPSSLARALRNRKDRC